MFTEAEVEFLIKAHENPELRSLVFQNPRTGAVFCPILKAGCPADVLERILEDRARKLGAKFTEFRQRSVSQLCASEERILRQVYEDARREAVVSRLLAL